MQQHFIDYISNVYNVMKNTTASFVKKDTTHEGEGGLRFMLLIIYNVLNT